MISLFKFKKYEKKINLVDQLKGFYGQHRSGWLYVLKSLKPIHNPKGTLLDSFIERTFCWNPKGVKPNLEPWIGFIHIPPKVPKWFQYEQSNDYIFNSAAWKESLPYCRGLFTLSNYHRKDLITKLDIPAGVKALSNWTSIIPRPEETVVADLPDASEIPVFVSVCDVAVNC